MAGRSSRSSKKACTLEQDDLAVDVVLQVLVRLVADAHRPHAAIAGQASSTMPLGQVGFQADAIDRLDVAAAGWSTRLRR